MYAKRKLKGCADELTYELVGLIVNIELAKLANVGTLLGEKDTV